MSSATTNESFFDGETESENLLALLSPVGKAVQSAWKEAVQKGLVRAAAEDTSTVLRTIIEAHRMEGAQPSEMTMTMNIEGDLMGYAASVGPGRRVLPEAPSSKSTVNGVTAVIGNTRVRFGDGTDALLRVKGTVTLVIDDEAEDFGTDFDLMQLDEGVVDQESDVEEGESQQEPVVT